MDRAVIKRAIRRIKEDEVLSIEEQERIKARKRFTKVWGDYHIYFKQPGNEYYRVFRDAFYDVKNGVELCEIKGVAHLVRKLTLKNPKSSAYLNFISKDELDYLAKGIKRITPVILDAFKDNTDRVFLDSKLYDIGVELREEFNREFGTDPEDVPFYELSSYVIIVPDKEFEPKNCVFRGKSKAMDKVESAPKANVTCGAPKQKDEPKYRQTTLDEGMGM